jgi:hypothetical protein
MWETLNSAFDTVAAIDAIDFEGAERAFAEKQDALRTANQLLPEMVTERDEARTRLAQVAAAVMSLHDAAPLNWLNVICGRVAAAKGATAGWSADEDGLNERSFDEWLFNARNSTAFKTALTERRVEELAAVLQAFCSGANHAQGEQFAASLARVRIASELERSAIEKLRVPHSAFATVVGQVDTLRAQVTRVLDVVERAREVRAVSESPSGARFEAAQKNVAKLEKKVKLALLELEHPDDVDDLEATKEELRVAKVALVEARNESIAAVVELAAHAFDFPELRLRFPKARLDDLVVAGGDVSSLRTLDQYENRVTIAETRNKVERAAFDGVECALKLFRLAPAFQRAFVKEARRLRQLAHPNIVEVRAVFVDPKSSRGVIEMPLYARRSVAVAGCDARVHRLRQVTCIAWCVVRSGACASHGHCACGREAGERVCRCRWCCEARRFRRVEGRLHSCHDGGDDCRPLDRLRGARDCARPRCEQGWRRLCVWFDDV